MKTRSKISASFLIITAATATYSSSASAQDPLIGQGKSIPGRGTSPGTAVTYGPTEEEAGRVVGRAKGIADVIKALGAPYSEHQAGNIRIFRWGQGLTDRSAGTVIRNELQVYTSPQGDIEGYSYKNKATITGLEQLQFIAGDANP